MKGRPGAVVLAALAAGLVATQPARAANPGLSAASAASVASALQKPAQVQSVEWLLADFAPVTLPVNRQPGDGFADQMLRYLIGAWPGVKHTFLPSNAQRGWQMIESGAHVCHPAAIRTPEREAKAYFVITYLLPPLQLIVRRDRLDKIPRNAAGEADLQRLLDQPDLRGAITHGRSYGTRIDEMLQARGANRSVTIYSPSDFGSKLLQMISLDRADYGIDYDFTLRYLSEHNPRLNQLVSLPIAGANTPLVAGIACPRTPWGLQATQEIEQRLRTPEAVSVIRESLYRWLTPEVRHIYGANIDAFYQDMQLGR